MPDHQIIAPFAGSQLPHVGSYRRALPVTLERLYENALDWEHLAWLHDSSFTRVDCLSAGPWGWRAAIVVSGGRSSVIELRLDRGCRRWVTRTLEGAGAGAEIWTTVIAERQDREGRQRWVDIVVDFFVPGIVAERRQAVGEGYAALYARLYDEDVAMMVERQRQLDRRIGGIAAAEHTRALGPRATLRLPMDVMLGNREFVLAETAGGLVIYPRQCPHQLGPLAAGALADGVVTCPWHGYRFDVRTGVNLTGQRCHLGDLPVIRVDDAGDVIVALVG